MAKLSQQLATSEPIRNTRTARQVYQFAQDKYQREEFARLKTEAEKIQQTQFSNVQSIDEYERKYNSLSSTMKQFFSTPQELRIQQIQRITENKIKVQTELEYAQKQLADIKRANEKGDEPEKQYWSKYIQGLSEGLGKLQGGQDVSYSDIESYASNMGDNARNKKSQRDKNREALAKLIETSSWQQDIKKAELEYGAGKIDWTNPASLKAVQNQSYVNTYGDYIGRDIASGNLSSTYVQAYRQGVGEKQFAETKKDIDTQLKLQADDYAKSISTQVTLESETIKNTETSKPKGWLEQGGTKLISWSSKGIDFSKGILVLGKNIYEASKPVIRKTVGTIPLFSIAGAGQTSMAGGSFKTEDVVKEIVTQPAVIDFSKDVWGGTKVVLRKTVGTIPLFSIAGAGQGTLAGGSFKTEDVALEITDKVLLSDTSKNIVNSLSQYYNLQFGFREPVGKKDLWKIYGNYKNVYNLDPRFTADIVMASREYKNDAKAVEEISKDYTETYYPAYKKEETNVREKTKSYLAGEINPQEYIQEVEEYNTSIDSVNKELESIKNSKEYKTLEARGEVTSMFDLYKEVKRKSVKDIENIGVIVPEGYYDLPNSDFYAKETATGEGGTLDIRPGMPVSWEKQEVENTIRLVGGAMKGIEVASYFTPQGKIAGGSAMVVGGAEVFQDNPNLTNIEKVLASAQIGLGSVLVVSGVGNILKFSGLYTPKSPKVVLHTPTFVKTMNVIIPITKVSLAGGLGAVQTYTSFKETGDIGLSFAEGLGASAGLLSGMYAKTISYKVNDLVRKLSDPAPRIKLDFMFDKNVKPYIRTGTSGNKQLIYQRMRNFKWYKPTSWKDYGKKGFGEFYGMKRIDALVYGKLKGYSEVSYWKLNRAGKLVWVTEPTTSFPELPKSQQLAGGFSQAGQGRGIQEYGEFKKYTDIRNKALIKLLKQQKFAFYTATPEEHPISKIKGRLGGYKIGEGELSDLKPYGKVSQSVIKKLQIDLKNIILKIKGYYTFGATKGISGGFWGLGSGEESSVLKGTPRNPTAYFGYTKGGVVNPAQYELEGLLKYGKEAGREAKYYGLTYSSKSGIAQAPVFKGEAEIVLEASTRIPIRTTGWMKVLGREIPIKEEIFFQQLGSSQSANAQIKAVLNSIKKDVGLKATIKNLLGTKDYASTFLPSSPISTKIGSSALSVIASSMKSSSKISSKVSSSVSSKISSPSSSQLSKMISSLLSYPKSSKISSPASSLKSSLKSSKISSPTSSIISEIITSSKPSRINPPPIIWWGEGKPKKKSKSDKELVQDLLYLPDFTSRAIGLEVDIMSGKQADKRLKQILTGLEIRNPISIRPNKLLRGIPN